MAKAFLQVRADEDDKEKASQILEELGTNISTVINMLLKQIILTKSIPFEIKMSTPYTAEEKIAEVKASMAMEDMILTKEDVGLLKMYQASKDKEAIRKQLLAEYTEA